MSAPSKPLSITPPPGVVKTESGRVVEGRWTDTQQIRFMKGRPEKRGGRLRKTTTVTSGLPRSALAWRDIANDYYAIGTYRKLYAYDATWAQTDITPYRTTGTLGNNPFTTTSGSSVVSVAHTAHGLSAGDTAIYAGSSAVGGVTPNGTFLVAAVTNANAYTFNVGSNASSTATGGGASVTYKYEIPVGTEYGSSGLGWGVGPWGQGNWGDARTNSTITFEPRIWALDHFGKILLAAYSGGSVYSFDPSLSQPWGRAAVVTGTPPTDARWLFVTPERFVFVLRENLIVSACAQGDYNTWTPASSNTAFARTLTEGSRVVGGRVLGPRVSLVWTDSALYVFQYTGSQFVYDSALVGKNCGLLAPHAAVSAGGAAYWMGPDNFYMYDGSVRLMPNAEDVRKFVFDDLPAATAFQCFAVYNPRHREIYFGYVATGMTTPSKYVTYHLDDQCWANGTDTRCAGATFPEADNRPFMTATDGHVYLHETGTDDNGAALNWSLTLGYYAMEKGFAHMDLFGIIFDFKDQVGAISSTVTGYNYLSDSAIEDSQTQSLAVADRDMTDWRVSGRYLGLSLSQTGVLGGYMRYGAPVAALRPSGRRT